MKTYVQSIPSALSVFTLACAVLVSGGCAATKNGQMTFRTPDKAVQAVADVAGTGDVARIETIFGKGSAEVIRSGDDVADREAALEVKAKIQEKVAFEDMDSRTKVPLFGNEGWEFPIPLVRVRGGWRFDTETGREEMYNRRIGRNELSTIATLHAIVDAQKEYRAGRYQGRTAAYATRVISTPGKRDGLYWPTKEGEKQSPMGPLVADAVSEGYSTQRTEPVPYHGYYYRPLSAQGPNAPGGARSYVDSRGLQTRGFAMVAWPARYGNSGVMTFLVDRQGIVFQKDLGPDTASAVAAIQSYDPDDSWTPTAD